VSDLLSKGRGFDSRSGHYQVVTTCMADCLWTCKPFRHITNTKVNSAFYPFGVGKSSTGLLAGVNAAAAHSPLSGGSKHCDFIWQVTLCGSVIGFLLGIITIFLLILLL